MTDLPAYPRQCFAASNSCQGFKNYYGEVFTDDRIDRLHIIKGGPGTGKSHFMKAVARYGRKRGYTVTEYYCSSDPSSLDGIVLRRGGFPTVGLLDGTAPHVCEPAIPGARDEIVNLGQFWNPKALAGKRDTIAALGQEKSTAYARANTCLRAAGEMDTLVDTLTDGAVRADRLDALAVRLLRREPSGEGFAIMPALRRAVGMTGKYTLHSYEAAARSLLLPDNGYGLGYRLTRRLLALSEERGLSVCVSFDPLYPAKPDGLLYPHTGLCILLGDAQPREETPTRAISLRRYTVPEVLRERRGELRRAAALREELVDTAVRHLATAADFHFELEKIYAATMDFGAKEAFTERFCATELGQ